MMEGRYERPDQLLVETVLSRAREYERKGLVYGEKSITLGPFIRHLADLSPCKFIFVKRDGRDVVRSFIDWHNRMFGSIYRECEDPGQLSPRARQAVASLPIDRDTSDYSRPRPGRADPWYEAWEGMSRLEMCAWYWSRINDLHLDQLEALPGDRWTSINYSSVTPAEILRVAEFVGLRGLSAETAERMLKARINSLRDRIDEDNEFPHWSQWPHSVATRFDEIAGDTMRRLGYDSDSGAIRAIRAEAVGTNRAVPAGPSCRTDTHRSNRGNMLGRRLRTVLYRAALRRFRPYAVGSLQEDRETVEKRCRSIAAQYERHNLNNPFALYRRFVEALAVNPRICVRPLRDLMVEVPARQIVVGLRHDVDADIRTGLRAARHLARTGLPGSFYLLHTAHYYGVIEDHVFRRSSALAEFLDGFIVAGCEIGVHSDALHLYLNHGIDGAAALREEIAWLRGRGCAIHGTAAHNSAPAYGAENFEIFRGRAFQGRKSLRRNGLRVPLQTLSEAELHLSYEANFPVPPRDSTDSEKYTTGAPPDAVRNGQWLRTYLVDNPLFDRDYHASIWLLGRDAWAIARHHQDRGLTWPVATDAVLDYLDTVPDGARVVVTLHPEYVSLDQT